MALIFVYGTLRRGFQNHDQLRGASLVGQGWTVAPYALYLGDSPFVVREVSQTLIRGELYSVDQATLAAIDVFEDHPREYRREETLVRLDTGGCHAAWLYFGAGIQGAPLNTGDYATHAPPRLEAPGSL